MGWTGPEARALVDALTAPDPKDERIAYLESEVATLKAILLGPQELHLHLLRNPDLLSEANLRHLLGDRDRTPYLERALEQAIKHGKIRLTKGEEGTLWVGFERYDECPGDEAPDLARYLQEKQK